MSQHNPPHRPYDEYGPAYSDSGHELTPEPDGDSYTFTANGVQHVRTREGYEMTHTEYVRRITPDGDVRPRPKNSYDP